MRRIFFIIGVIFFSACSLIALYDTFWTKTPALTTITLILLIAWLLSHGIVAGVLAYRSLGGYTFGTTTPRCIAVWIAEFFMWLGVLLFTVGLFTVRTYVAAPLKLCFVQYLTLAFAVAVLGVIVSRFFILLGGRSTRIGGSTRTPNVA